MKALFWFLVPLLSVHAGEARAASANVSLAEPISANVFLSTLKEQVAALESVLTHPTAASIVDHHRALLRKEGKFLLVKGFNCTLSRHESGCEISFQYGQLGVEPGERFKDYALMSADLRHSPVIRWEEVK